MAKFTSALAATTPPSWANSKSTASCPTNPPAHVLAILGPALRSFFCRGTIYRSLADTPSLSSPQVPVRSLHLLLSLPPFAGPLCSGRVPRVTGSHLGILSFLFFPYLFFSWNLPLSRPEFPSPEFNPATCNLQTFQRLTASFE